MAWYDKHHKLKQNAPSMTPYCQLYLKSCEEKFATSSNSHKMFQGRSSTRNHPLNLPNSKASNYDPRVGGVDFQQQQQQQQVQQQQHFTIYPAPVSQQRCFLDKLDARKVIPPLNNSSQFIYQPSWLYRHL